MKKSLKIFLSILICSIPIMSIGNAVKASGTAHSFSLLAYDENSDEEGSGDEILDGSDIEPGQEFKVDLYYVPGSQADVEMQVGITYDPNLVEPVYDGSNVYVNAPMETVNRGGMWPASGTKGNARYTTSWGIQYNDIPAQGLIMLLITDSTHDFPLENEGVMCSVYFTVKDTAAAGSSAVFGLDPDETKVSSKDPVTLSGLNLNVYGEMSADTSLSALSVSNGATTYSLSPVFTAGTSDKSFTAIVPNQISSVDITAATTDSSASIVNSFSPLALDVGNNTQSIIVQAQDGTEETYEVNVYRLSNDSSLKSLSLSGITLNPSFTSGTTSYTATVPYSTGSTTVSGSTTDTNASIDSGTGAWTLSNTGGTANTKNIVVKAENCDSKYSSVPNNSCSSTTYKVDVTRTAPSTNANLSYLTVDGVDVPNFSPSTYEYTLDAVPNATTSVNVNALVEDTGKATITSTLGNKTLAVGDNKITVTVTAEDGVTTQDYVINIRRLSNDSKLGSLTVSSTPNGSLSPSFSKTFYDSYTYTAPSSVETVTVAATPNDSSATILSGTGTYNIDTTSLVEVVVEAEDKTTSTYKINLVREKSDNNYLSSLSLDGYTISPSFNKETTSYTATVSATVDTVNVSATAEDIGRATIESGTGSQSLSYGSNSIVVTVKAENGSTKDYTITVNREKKKISELSSLTVDGTSVPDFSETTIEYTLSKVPFEKTSVEIDATAKDSDATVTGTGTINLNTGDNKLFVVVTAHDGVTKTSYIINIEREKDSNAYLSDIKVDGTTIEDFLKTDNDYDLTVENNVTSLNLAVTTESSSATYEITGNSGFVTGANNEVTITVTAEDGTINVYTINVARKKSSNNYLSAISLSTGSLSPSFDKDKTAYTVDVDRDVTSITITPTLADSSASYEITGPSSLEVGSDNEYKIIVTSENGTPKTYTITVNRLKSSNNYLASLTVDGVSVPSFNKETTNYTVNVDSAKTKVTLDATTEEEHATISGLGDIDLVTGVNNLPVTVTAEDGTEKTYTVVINKAKSNNSTLSALSILQTSINPSFSPETTSYTAEVSYATTNIDIEATASAGGSTISGTGNKSLNTGDNTFNIEVEAEDGVSKTTYTIVVTREKNNNANLSNIELSDGYSVTPSFDPDVTEYTVDVPNNIKSIDITAHTQDTNAVGVTNTGRNNLNTGKNEIDLVVTAENGTTTKTYKLTINRAKSTDATLKEIVLSNGTLDPTFDSDTTEYEVSVNNEITSLGVTATPTSDAASATVSGNDNLEVGENEVTITVTAEDGSLKVYTIKVTREKSANNFLSSLSVTDSLGNEYITNFSKTNDNYTIAVDNSVDSVTISSTLEDSTSTKTGDGLKSLSVGLNSFDVVVTSETNVPRTYKINITRAANSNAYLSSLEVENYSISPSFDKDTVSYTLTVDSTTNKVVVNATAASSTSTVAGTGEITLSTGTNNVPVTVTAEDNTSKIYTIVITKEASTNNYLSNISLNNEALEDFNRETLEYTKTVANSVTSINIDATKEDETATVTGLGLKTLTVGDNNFDIVVTSESNENRTYKLKIVRTASNNKYLSDLTVDGETIENFNKDTLSYTLNVANSVSSLTIDAEAEDETATVTGTGEISLNTGINEIPVAVTAEDGSVKTYVITVNRAKNSNNYLSSLSVDEGTISPSFNKDIITYNLTVPYETSNLTINAVPEASTSTIEKEGDTNLSVGANEVTIKVTAENGDEKTYTLNVTRQQQVNNFLTGITITDNNGVNYYVSPDFDKTIQNYQVEISPIVSSVNIAVEKSDETLTVTGDGTVQITSLPQEQDIVVTTTGGIPRTYTLEFVRGASNNANLLSLSVNPGSLSPAFNANTLSYDVNLSTKVDSINVIAQKSETTQTITGAGSHSLTSGRNEITVTVTSESGAVKFYTIIVNVPNDSSNNVLTSLTVDKGTLTPSFDKDVKTYTVNLENEETEIEISATGDNNISGIGTHSLVKGTNVFEIVSTDESGNENKYKVIVNNGAIDSTKLADLSITDYDLKETFNENSYDYTASIVSDSNSVEINAVPQDENATVTVTGNNNLVDGNNIVTILVTKDGLEPSTYTINLELIASLIKSSTHDINDLYVESILPQELSSTTKDEMTNPNKYLKICNLEDNEISDSDIIKTGYKIKLIINGEEYDSKTLIIKGDINSDGTVNIADYTRLRKHILNMIELNSYQLEASKLNNDDIVNIADYTRLRKHILGIIDLFERAGE